MPDDDKVLAAPPLRIRAVDQIKRLPQLIIGFAMVFAANNFYNAWTLTQSHPLMGSMILPLSALTIFISLVIPSYLSIERHLDEVLLDPARRNPSRFLVTYNILAMTLTSVIYAVLASSIQMKTAALFYFSFNEMYIRFVEILLVTYIYDFITIAFTIWIGNYSRSEKSMKNMMWLWLGLDAFIIALLCQFLYNGYQPQYIVIWACFLGFIHLSRLIIEFVTGPDFYLPPWNN